MQVFSAPEGYQLDPSSGLYYRETQISGPDGQAVEHIVWFNAETGAYTQQSRYMPPLEPPPVDMTTLYHGDTYPPPLEPPPVDMTTLYHGGTYPPDPSPLKRPIFKRIAIPVVAVICVTVIAVVGIKVVPPLIEKAGESGLGSTAQSGDSKLSSGGLFGGAEQTKEGEMGNTVMNLQNGGLMAYHNGWVYYADATKGGALYARKEGQSADKAILIAPGQICAINVLGDELVYLNSSGGGQTRLAVNGESTIYLPHSFGQVRGAGGYCPVTAWPMDKTKGYDIDFGHIIQFYAGIPYRVSGVKKFEQSGGGLSKPVQLGNNEQKYCYLVLTKDGIYAAKGEAGASFSNMTMDDYVQLTEEQETVVVTVENPRSENLQRVSWLDGKPYLEKVTGDFGSSILSYDIKTQTLSEIGAGDSLIAWDNSLFYIGSDYRTIVEIKPGAATGETVYTSEEDIGILMCETDGRFAALSGSWKYEYIFEREGDGLKLVSKTESGEDETAQYLTSSSIFELDKKTHKYFDRYNGGINPY